MFNYLRERKLKSSLKKNKRQHTFLNFVSMKNVLILFDYADLNDIIHIAKDLEGMNKRVFLWTYDSNKDAIPAKRQSLSLQTITAKDVSKMGGISRELLAVFDSQIYDTIIDLSSEDQYPLKYLLANNSARFSIGTVASEDKLYDFILHRGEEMNISAVYDQIKFYLGSMRGTANNS